MHTEFLNTALHTAQIFSLEVEAGKVVEQIIILKKDWIRVAAWAGLFF